MPLVTLALSIDWGNEDPVEEDHADKGTNLLLQNLLDIILNTDFFYLFSFFFYSHKKDVRFLFFFSPEKRLILSKIVLLEPQKYTSISLGVWNSTL